MKVTTCQTDSIEDVIRILKGVGIDVDEGELEEEPKQDLSFGIVIESMRWDLCRYRAEDNNVALDDRLRKFARRGWNGKGMFIRAVPMTGEDRPYIIMRDTEGKWVPWLASQTDMLTDDWYEVHRCSRLRRIRTESTPSRRRTAYRSAI